MGDPAPEGVHRDGVEYIIVRCVGTKNISDVVSSLYRPEYVDTAFFKNTLIPGEALLVDDRALMHGVSTVSPVGSYGYRDMILMGHHYWRRNHYRANWKESLHDKVKPEHVI